MIKLFSSGSCRLVTSIANGYNKVEPIHSMFYNFVGINFLGKFHNTKQHIQFIEWIKGKELPELILRYFFTSYGKYCDMDEGTNNKETNPNKKHNIQTQFDNCDVYIFEICSLKLFQKDGYQVQFEIAKEYDETVQSEEDFIKDLYILRDLIPIDRKIIFQCHFRPNIIHNDPSKAIPQRETIYRVLHDFCSKTKNTYLYDPSELLKSDHSLYDNEVHFNATGHSKSFEYIYNNYINVL